MTQAVITSGVIVAALLIFLGLVLLRSRLEVRIGPAGGGLHYSAAMGSMVMYGGLNEMENVAETWQWTGEDWKPLASPRAGASA